MPQLIKHLLADVETEIVELGYRTRPYKETIRDQIQWMKQEGLICA